jgi:protease PrsW
MSIPLPALLVSLVPVGVFLVGLVYLDSYRLVGPRQVLVAIAAGIVSALISLQANTMLAEGFLVEMRTYARYIAPFVEETTKALYLVYLVRSKKIGFMVDAAIYGFTIGTGFALAENISYLFTLPDDNLFMWLIRGLGTAIMHGGATAIFALIGKNLADTKANEHLFIFAPGFAIAFALHSLFNHFFLPPLYSTISVLIVIPVVLMVVFQQSEKATRHWLGVGFDTDVQLLETITKGEISTTKVGMYLHTLHDRFRPEVVVDLLCYLRIFLELAIQAKGILLMRESGFDVPPDPAVQEQFKELQYLRRSIGTTGQLALAPFIHMSSRDLWQLHTLQK